MGGSVRWFLAKKFGHLWSWWSELRNVDSRALTKISETSLNVNFRPHDTGRAQNQKKELK